MTKKKESIENYEADTAISSVDAIDKAVTLEQTQEEKDFINDLSDQEDFDSGASAGKEAQERDEQEFLKQAGDGGARALVGVMEGAIQQFGHPEFSFNEKAAEKVVQSAVPLFVKYGGQIPPWLLAYKEEAAFVLAVGMLGFSSVKTVKKLKKTDIENDAAKVENKHPDGGE